MEHETWYARLSGLWSNWTSTLKSGIHHGTSEHGHKVKHKVPGGGGSGGDLEGQVNQDLQASHSPTLQDLAHTNINRMSPAQDNCRTQGLDNGAGTPLPMDNHGAPVDPNCDLIMQSLRFVPVEVGV